MCKINKLKLYICGLITIMTELKDKLEELFLKILDKNIKLLSDDSTPDSTFTIIPTITSYVKFLIKSGIKDTKAEDVKISLFKELEKVLKQEKKQPIDPMILLMLSNMNKSKPTVDNELLNMFNTMIESSQTEQMKMIMEQSNKRFEKGMNMIAGVIKHDNLKDIVKKNWKILKDLADKEKEEKESKEEKDSEKDKED